MNHSKKYEYRPFSKNQPHRILIFEVKRARNTFFYMLSPVYIFTFRTNRSLSKLALLSHCKLIK